MADKAENRPSAGQVPLPCVNGGTQCVPQQRSLSTALNLEGVILLSRQRWTVSVPALAVSPSSPTFLLPSLPCDPAEDLLSCRSFAGVCNNSLNEESSERGNCVVLLMGMCEIE